jgi:Tfp pilus assembly protein PilV
MKTNSMTIRASSPRLPNHDRSSESGFTLTETAASLVILMVVGLGVASLFVYATNINSGANDREMASAIGQKRMEWLRTMQYSAATRNLAYSYPNGGLGATSNTGVSETETRAGRTYSVVTRIQDTSVVPAGMPDAGQPTLKTIIVTVTPQGAGTFLGSVTLSTQRSTLTPGAY